MGFPKHVWRLLTSVYEIGCTRFRILGRIASPSSHVLQRGLHQGCPLSVWSFNAIQVPLLACIKEKYPEVEPLAYADDLVLISQDKQKLEAALIEVARYMAKAHIKVNAAKTRYWCSAGLVEPLRIGEEIVHPDHTIVILGMQFADSTVRLHSDHDAGEIQGACKVLARLPLAVQARQAVYSAVVAAKLLFCPWRTRWTAKALTGARSTLISARCPSLHKGARAQAMVTVHILKGHRLDPYYLKFWR